MNRTAKILMLAFLGLASPVHAQDKAQDVETDPPTPSSSDNQETRAEVGWQIRPRWRLQYDVAEIDSPAGLPDTGTFDAVRRARLGIDLDMPSGFSFRIDGELQDDAPQIVDAYLMWKQDDAFVSVGQQKAVNPLDLNSSNLNISFMERPAFYGAFNYGRGTGILAGYERDDFGAYAGIFTDNLILLNDVKRNSLFADFRTYWSPQVGQARLHLAGSYHVRDLKDFSGIPTRYRQRAFVRLTDTRYIGTSDLFVAKETRYGLEMAGGWKRVHMAGEVHWLEADRIGAADLEFFGAYGEVGVFLTKDSRPLKAGAFGAIKPNRPMDKGGFGALQFNMRYDYLDLNSRGVSGGKQDGYMASLIWTPVEYLRLMVNYARLDYSGASVAVAGDRDYAADVIGARFQIYY